MSSRSALPDPNLRPALVLAMAVMMVVVLPWIPGVALVTWPLAWLGTLAHETGHGLGAMAVGGEIVRIQVFVDGSGLATNQYTQLEPWGRAVVSASGLVGPAVLSTLLLWAGLWPRLAKLVAIALGLALWVEAATVTAGFATAVAVGWGAVAIVAGARLSAAAVRLGTLVVAVQLALHVYRTSAYLFMLEAWGGRPSDVANLATSLGGHPLMWGVGVAVLDAGLLGVGLLGFFLGDRLIGRGIQP